MKKTAKIIGYVILFIAAAIIAISIVEAQEAQHQSELQRYKCATVDQRLIAWGWVDCTQK